MCAVPLENFIELGYEFLSHPSFSPDLPPPRDYVLIPNLKKWLGGNKFRSIDEIVAQTKAYFEDLDKSYSLEGV